MISQKLCRTKILIKSYISIFVAKKCRTSSTCITFNQKSPLFKKLYFFLQFPELGEVPTATGGIVEGKATLLPFFSTIGLFQKKFQQRVSAFFQRKRFGTILLFIKNIPLFT